MTPIQQLLSERSDLDRKIMELRASEKDEVIERVRTLMATANLSISDISDSHSVPNSIRKKVLPKYQDDKGNTWSGRGLRPRWMSDAIDAGKNQWDFAI